MNPQDQGSSDRYGGDSYSEIDSLCDAFEDDYQAGNSPKLEEYLSDNKLADKSKLYFELLALEIDYRLKRNESVSQEEYEQRFPAFSSITAAVFTERFHHGIETSAAKTNSVTNKSQKPRSSGIKVTCPNGHEFRVKSRYAGKRGKCAHCEAVVKVPATELTQHKTNEKSSISITDTTIGHYQVLGVLGSGAFGRIYRVRDPKLKREVALKVPRLGLFQNEQAASRFRDEPLAAAKLRHPNIVAVYDADTDGFTGYIAYELVDGKPLSDILKDRQKLPPREAAVLVEKIARALHYAHMEGVVHRDIKPDNILINHRGEPQVTDFGLARHERGEQVLTMENAMMGTPAYMSPEQASGKSREADGRSDQWSLGVMLYELLSGEKPFSGESSGEVLHKVLQKEPTSLLRSNEMIPTDLAVICHKSLSKQPQDRYANCEVMADDLESWLRGDPITARPIGYFERAVRWGKKEPWLAGLSAAVVALAIVSTLSAAAFFSGRQRLANALEQTTEAVRKEQKAVSNLQAQQQQLIDAKKLAEQEQAKAEDAVTQLKNRQAELTIARKNAETIAEKEKQLRIDLEEANYSPNISRSVFDLVNGNLRGSFESFALCKPRPERWEWRYVAAQLDQVGSYTPLSKLGVVDSSYSVNLRGWDSTGKVLAVNPRTSRVIHLIDTSGSELKRRKSIALDALGSHPIDWSWHPSQPYLAVAGGSKIIVFDTTSGQAIFESDDYCLNVDWSPDGQMLATCLTSATRDESLNQQYQIVVLLDAKKLVATRKKTNASITLKKLLVDTGGSRLGRIMELQWSHNCQALAVVSSEVMALFGADFKRGIHVYSKEGRLLWEKYSPCKDQMRNFEIASWSPDDSLLAVSASRSTKDRLGIRSVQLLDAKSGKKKKEIYDDDKTVWSIAWNPMGSSCAIATSDSLIITDIDSNQKIFSLPIQASNSYYDICWNSYNGQIVAAFANALVTYSDRSLASLAPMVPREVILETDSGITDFSKRLLWSEDSQSLSALRRNSITTWNATTQELLNESTIEQFGLSPTTTKSFEISPNGFRAVALQQRKKDAPYQLEVLDLRTKKSVLLMSIEASNSYPWINEFWSNDGSRIAIVSQRDQPELTVYDSSNGTMLFRYEESARSTDRRKYFVGLAFSPNGRKLAFASPSGEFRVVDCSTWDLVFKGKSKGRLMWNYSGSRLLTTNDVEYLLYNDEGKLLSQGPWSHGFQYAAALSPDGAILVGANSNSKEIGLYNVQTGQRFFVIPGIGGREYSWSPDGNSLALLTHGGEIKVLRAPPRPNPLISGRLTAP